MTIPLYIRRSGGIAGLLLASWASQAAHAAPTVSDALKLTPMQKDVDFATPAKDAIEQCTIKPEKFNSQSAWVVRDKGGQILRRFVDTNADNVVDQWCYYQDGLEVYRDVDADFNGKPDQCRWFNTAGTRWGLDTNEDGKVDRWKEISAEEASDELVHALGEKDPAPLRPPVAHRRRVKGAGLRRNANRGIENQNHGSSRAVSQAVGRPEDCRQRRPLVAIRRCASGHHARRHRWLDQRHNDL